MNTKICININITFDRINTYIIQRKTTIPDRHLLSVHANHECKDRRGEVHLVHTVDLITSTKAQSGTTAKHLQSTNATMCALYYHLVVHEQQVVTGPVALVTEPCLREMAEDGVCRNVVAYARAQSLTQRDVPRAQHLLIVQKLLIGLESVLSESMRCAGSLLLHRHVLRGLQISECTRAIIKIKFKCQPFA